MKDIKLILKDGSEFKGKSFGHFGSVAGEVVFTTGMVGYPESLTDPSFKGQILVMTYPLIGNYGVPEKLFWESDRIQVAGLVVSTYNHTPSHALSERSLSRWLTDEKIPAIEYKDTRLLTKLLRDKGSQLGKIIAEENIPFLDPNMTNLVEVVSTKKIEFFKSLTQNPQEKTVLYIDCGGKKNMILCLLRRGVNVVVVPWDFDPFIDKNYAKLKDVVKEKKVNFRLDGVVISNGPGDPLYAKKTVAIIKKVVTQKIPLLGICLGHQLLTLAGDGETEKLKYGHRSQNQPCLLADSKRCFITTQNHGFAVKRIPDGFKPWFINANDNTNEGIIHEKLPFMSVQFHPEATPGPQDTEWIFDYYLEKV